jgi:hypothetical protein
MTVQPFVILTLRFRQESPPRGRWLGECVELGTATYGRTLRQTHDELIELVSLHLDALEDIGERARFFEEHGIQLYTDSIPTAVTSTVPVDAEYYVHAHRVRVPVPA